MRAWVIATGCAEEEKEAPETLDLLLSTKQVKTSCASHVEEAYCWLHRDRG